MKYKFFYKIYNLSLNFNTQNILFILCLSAYCLRHKIILIAIINGNLRVDMTKLPEESK